VLLVVSSHAVGVSGDGRRVLDVEDEHICYRDLDLMAESRKTHLWLPRLVRIAAAAANNSGSIVVLVVISKSDSPIASNAAPKSSPEHSPGASQGSSVNSIDSYSLKLISVTTGSSAKCSSSSPPSSSSSSSSVTQAKLGMDAVNAQLNQLQRQHAALGRRRHALPVIDAQEPRLRREMKAVSQQLADLHVAQRLLHRNCAAALLGGDNCRVVAEAALDARSAMSSDFNLTIHSGCAAPGLSDLHLSAAAWPETVRLCLTELGVRVYNSEKAVAVSADGRVAACSQGNAVQIRNSSSAEGVRRVVELPNAVLALALHATGSLMAVAVTSLTGGR
jgi:hypothetical protein